MGRIYLPFENPNRGMVPTFGPILPGTPHPTIVGNPHLRGGPFVGLPGYGLGCGKAGTNLLTDPDFPNLDNWTNQSIEGGETIEVGPQFAMDQGEFLGGLHLIVDADGEGQRQSKTIVDATDYTASAWVYVLSGVVKVQVDKGDATYTATASTKIREWERVIKSFTSTGVNGVFYLMSHGAAAEGYFWMPQLETGTVALPARVGAQPGSYIYVPSPISETQVPWSIICIATPDYDYDAGMPDWERVWELNEDGTNRVRLLLHQTGEYMQFNQENAGGATSLSATTITWARGDHLHYVVTCDGYNVTFYMNGVDIGTQVMKSVQPTVLAIGDYNATGGAPFNGVIDDFAFIHGCLPEFRAQELYRASLRGVPLHGVLESLS